ncbi:phosphatidylserine decarboxylase [Paucidesulfovibrio gracilis DSM 16080]|uniref:Phosphatidylserine decarboxylase proenzyme n=1 Tax=Paucidesulfovibrio gracilis DSM 16080 TaxID=1121449 RepID=A0A1T4WHB9_9BACT|nr:phosphatidylserine decarboxylase family protein [Paucidesulfovibrio gracilis]SKA76690.1 phosphatidylserine decarboxylase [Paucidesulfovibrio gracilis DSM 16080]
MQQRSIGICPEGYPFLILAAFATVVFAILEWWFMALVGLAATAFVGHFFRDPERVPPEDVEAVVSPADGRIVKIARESDPLSGEEKQVICVFMNLVDVHVNRMPVSGKIDVIRYIPGAFFNASLDKASTDNERNILEVVGKGNQRFVIVQIAGLIARRIVCWSEKGDKLKRGERFGMIRFGSRVDLYLPEGFEPSVVVGEQVFAGETAIAKRKASNSI